jgi:hypothetical protein
MRERLMLWDKNGATASAPGQMDLIMLEVGNQVRDMDKVNSGELMATLIKAIGKMTLNMGKEKK